MSLIEKWLRLHVLLSRHQYRLNKRRYAKTLKWLKTQGRAEAKILDEAAAMSETDVANPQQQQQQQQQQQTRLKQHRGMPMPRRGQSKSVFFALRNKLKNYLRRLTSLSFNGSNYDLPLLKTGMYRCLNLNSKKKQRQQTTPRNTTTTIIRHSSRKTQPSGPPKWKRGVVRAPPGTPDRGCLAGGAKPLRSRPSPSRTTPHQHEGARGSAGRHCDR